MCLEPCSHPYPQVCKPWYILPVEEILKPEGNVKRRGKAIRDLFPAGPLISCAILVGLFLWASVSLLGINTSRSLFSELLPESLSPSQLASLLLPLWNLNLMVSGEVSG